MIIGGSGSGKRNSLFTLINYQPDIDKIYLYCKDPYEAKYQFLISKQESTGLKHLNDSKAFVEHLNDTDDIYKNIEDRWDRCFTSTSFAPRLFLLGWLKLNMALLLDQLRLA